MAKDSKPKDAGPKDVRMAKLLARIMAAQALYSWEASGSKTAWTKEDLTPDMAAFYREQAGSESGAAPKVKEDRKLFREIATGALATHVALDALIAPYLERDHSVAHLPMALKSILRAAVYELTAMGTPPGVVIKEYAKVTEMLANEEEVPFVHAVLDKVSKGPKKPYFPDLSAITAETLSLLLTRDPQWVKKAQQLRHKVFFQEEAEQQGVAAQFTGEEIDEDKFDAVCDHLMVLDTPENGEPRVVGTYRLLRSTTELKFDHYYTETEFDISNILAQKENLLELGRSCIAPEYRNGGVIQLLWRAIGAYLMHFDIEYMFGCASFHGMDPLDFQQAISYLHHKHAVPAHLRTKPQPGWQVELPILPLEKIDRKAAVRQLPPLLKGYLRLGGCVGEGVVVDKFCHTVDVCIVVARSTIPERYKEHFLSEIPGGKESA